MRLLENFLCKEVWLLYLIDFVAELGPPFIVSLETSKSRLSLICGHLETGLLPDFSHFFADFFSFIFRFYSSFSSVFLRKLVRGG